MAVQFLDESGTKKVLFTDESGTKKVSMDEGCCCDVTVECCPSPLNRTLTITFSGETGDCACSPSSVQITWDGTKWTGTNACYSGSDIRLECLGATAQDFALTITCGAVEYPGAAYLTQACSPLNLVFDLNPTNCCSGTITATVTE